MSHPLGPYVPHDPRLPVMGVGLGEETLRQKPSRPIGTFALWAVQVSDVDWDRQEPRFGYELHPVSSRDLQVAGSMFGHPVQRVAILMQRPVSLADADRALANTPYEVERSCAVVNVDDTALLPRPHFLICCRRRDEMDWGGGHKPIEQAANEIDGRPVHLVERELPAHRTAAPRADVTEAMAPPAAEAAVPAVDPVPVQQQKRSGFGFWITVGVAAGIGYLLLR